MSLAPGTALQNGHYVVDALLEAAPNGDLYWGTHVVTGMQVFIQVFPVTMSQGGDDLSALMARFEGVAFAPQSPLPNPFQLFLGEEQTLCLAMSTTVGLPWTQACKTRSPMSPRQALATIRQVAASVGWLKQQGIIGLDLAPNRIWVTEDSDRVTLTGLPQAHLDCTTAPSTPDTTVQFLAKLLYSLLTGKVPTDATPEALKADLNRQLPTLSPVIVQAIITGVRIPPDAANAMTVAQWLNELPDTAPAHHVEPPSRPAQPRQQPAVGTSTSSRFRLYPALAGTALVAAIAGLSFGTFWRLNAKSLPGAIQFEPNQTFPPQAEWSGDRPDVSFDSPYVPAQRNPIRREDWYDSTRESPVRGVLDAPANAAEPTSILSETNRDTVVDSPDEASPSSTFDAGSSPSELPATDNSAPDGESSNPASEEPSTDNAPQIDELMRNLPDAPEDASLIN